jgi:hypothetical protein
MVITRAQIKGDTRIYVGSRLQRVIPYVLFWWTALCAWVRSDVNGGMSWVVLLGVTQPPTAWGKVTWKDGPLVGYYR